MSNSVNITSGISISIGPARRMLSYDPPFDVTIDPNIDPPAHHSTLQKIAAGATPEPVQTGSVDVTADGGYWLRLVNRSAGVVTVALEYSSGNRTNIAALYPDDVFGPVRAVKQTAGYPVYEIVGDAGAGVDVIVTDAGDPEGEIVPP